MGIEVDYLIGEDVALVDDERYVREEKAKELEAENAKLRNENAKLVKVLHEVESEAVDAFLGLQHDCELLTAELEDRFKKHWHEQCENEKLRKLCSELLRMAGSNDPDFLHWPEIHDELRNVGVEIV